MSSPVQIKKNVRTENNTDQTDLHIIPARNGRISQYPVTILCIVIKSCR